MKSENDVAFWLFMGRAVGVDFCPIVAQQMGHGTARQVVLGYIWMKARGEI